MNPVCGGKTTYREGSFKEEEIVRHQFREICKWMWTCGIKEGGENKADQAVNALRTQRERRRRRRPWSGNSLGWSAGLRNCKAIPQKTIAVLLLSSFCLSSSCSPHANQPNQSRSFVLSSSLFFLRYSDLLKTNSEEERERERERERPEFPENSS